MFKNLSLTQNIGYGSLLFGLCLISIVILDSIDYAFVGIVVSVLSIIMATSSFFLIKRSFDALKVLGNGKLTKNLTVKAQMFSKSAVEKIAAAGGKAEVI